MAYQLEYRREQSALLLKRIKRDFGTHMADFVQISDLDEVWGVGLSEKRGEGLVSGGGATLLFVFDWIGESGSQGAGDEHDY